MKLNPSTTTFAFRTPPRVSPGVRFILSGLLGFAVSLTTACKESESETLTFRYHLPEAPVTLDPAVADDVYSFAVIDRLFDGLMRLDRIRNIPVPDLALSHTVSKDGLVYEFHLLPGARFHNGRPLYASDIKYSWERVLTPEVNSAFAWIFDGIDGVDAYRQGAIDTVRGIVAEDPHLLRVQLVEPSPAFLYRLTMPTAAVVPHEEVLRLGERFAQQPVGSGPFRFVQWERNFRVELASFDQHPRQPPQVERLIYVMASEEEALELYGRGQLDLVGRLPPDQMQRIRQTFPADLRQIPSFLWSGFCFRCDRTPFDDVRVRQALALAVDRQALVEEYGELDYTPSRNFLTSVISEFSTLAADDQEFDLEEARRLLSAAGYPRGTGVPKLVYATTSGVLYEKVTHSLVASFAELGVQVEVINMDFGSLQQSEEEGRFAFFRFSFSAMYPDPEAMLFPIFHSRSSLSLRFAYANPEVDSLLERGRAETVPELRSEIYRQAQKMIIEDAPCVALFHDSIKILLHPRWKDLPIGYLYWMLEIERIQLAGGQ